MAIPTEMSRTIVDDAIKPVTVKATVHSAPVTAVDVTTSDDDGAGFNLDVVCLVKKVNELQNSIDRLAMKVDFLLSYLGINTDKSYPAASPPSTCRLSPSTPPSSPWSGLDVQPGTDVVSSNLVIESCRKSAPLSSAALQHAAVVSALYRDFKDRERRSRNIVISGIASIANSTVTSDAAAVKRLLDSEFDRSFSVVKCHRLGRPVSGRIQPVMATLGTEADARYVVQNAKQLRRSSDEHVRDAVYINADVTRAESLAAYQRRRQRRHRAGEPADRSRDKLSVDGGDPTVLGKLHPLSACSLVHGCADMRGHRDELMFRY